MTTTATGENGREMNYVLEDQPGSAPVVTGPREQKFNIWKYISGLLFSLIVINVIVMLATGRWTSSSSDDSSTTSTTEAFTLTEGDLDVNLDGTAATTEAAATTTTEIGYEDEGRGDDSSPAPTADYTRTYLTGTQPNIIFLLADDIGWGDIGHNGGTFSTPNIDAVLEKGVEFTNFYSHPLCTPSRVAFLTGRYAWRTGVQYPEVIHAMMGAHIPMGQPTFAEVTKELGYNNYYVGRWGVGYASWEYTPLGRGFDEFFGYFGPEGGYYNHTTDHFELWHDVYDMWNNKEPYVVGNGTYSEDLFKENFMKYIDMAVEADKPFTITYSAQTGHAPIDDDDILEPPATYDECTVNDEQYKPRQYYCNKVKYLDDIWGELITYLKATNDAHGQSLWDNSLILMTSDNGALPYRGPDATGSDWGCNWPLRSSKVTNYEGGIKTWAGMWGGVLPAGLHGTTHDGLTHIVDFGATAMRLAMDDETAATGVNWSGSELYPVDGINLYEMEEHNMVIHTIPTQFWPDWLHEGGVVDLDVIDWAAYDGEWKYINGLPDDTLMGVGWYRCPGDGYIDGDTDPALWARAGSNCSHGCVFHIPSDPSEMTDLSSLYPEIQDYFYNMIMSVFYGGLDDDYHPGQNYGIDYRGYWDDNMMRPYLNDAASDVYQARMHSNRQGFANYTYADAPVFWQSTCHDFNCKPFLTSDATDETEVDNGYVIDEEEANQLYEEYLAELADLVADGETVVQTTTNAP